MQNSFIGLWHRLLLSPGELRFTVIGVRCCVRLLQADN
ncbi:hypothetical protein CSC43_1263 [Pseudomonas aeruginosa]|nr:hypothetical protein CSC43_1263 [Pseudomonas aeruginosa]